MCTVDILPTVLNLWGFDYDSRLLAGKDIFSDAEHAAILSNGSFITRKIKYNSGTGEVTYLIDESRVSDHYVEYWVNEVKRRFTISTEILNADYYQTLSKYLNIADVDVDTNNMNTSNTLTKRTTGGNNWLDEDY
jgi:phosphoglycerol transferase MdoB-like AlkP superfamily enzyme